MPTLFNSYCPSPGTQRAAITAIAMGSGVTPRLGAGQYPEKVPVPRELIKDASSVPRDCQMCTAGDSEMTQQTADYTGALKTKSWSDSHF
jgi:hypothetical protein